MSNLYPETDLNNRNLGWIISEIKKIQAEIASGGIQVVSLAADMTNHNVIYVYIGSEVGMNTDHWYYWDTANSVWADGGAWGSASITLPLAVADGGTGASDAATARSNLFITPANIGAVSTSDTINISHGGTGATTKAGARSNLEINPANIGAEPAFTKLSITKGGTNASDAATARSNLGINPGNIGAEPAFTVLPVTKGGTGESSIANVKTSLGIAGINSSDHSSAAGGASKQITVANSTHGIIITDGSVPALKDIILYNVTSSGTVSITRVLSATNIAITAAANSITIQNNDSTYCFIFWMNF